MHIEIELQRIKDGVAQEAGYNDWEELICIEDGPINLEDYNGITNTVALRFLNQYIKFTSINNMPPFDGKYLCAVKITEECGNTHDDFIISQCSMNKFNPDQNTEITHWQLLPPKPLTD